MEIVKNKFKNIRNKHFSSIYKDTNFILPLKQTKNRRQYKGILSENNQHISDCKTGVSTYRFPRHVCFCTIKNTCLEELFFSLNIKLRLIKSDRLETIEKHFHLKGCDTMKNPGRS